MDICPLLMQSDLIVDALGGIRSSCLMDLSYLALHIIDDILANERLRYICRIISRWRSKTGCSHGLGSERRFNVVHLLSKVSANGDYAKSDCESQADYPVNEPECLGSTHT